MTAGLSHRWRRFGQSLALWLGLIALSIQGLVPLCANVSTANGNAIVICTAHGYETIQLDPQGNPVPGAPAADHSTCFLCLGCQLAGGFPAPAMASLSPPLHTVALEPARVQAVEPVSVRLSPYASRAPPAASVILV